MDVVANSEVNTLGMAYAAVRSLSDYVAESFPHRPLNHLAIAARTFQGVTSKRDSTLLEHGFKRNTIETEV